MWQCRKALKWLCATNICRWERGIPAGMQSTNMCRSGLGNGAEMGSGSTETYDSCDDVVRGKQALS